MYLPPKHAPDCRGAENPMLGNGMVCRACRWYETVDRLVDAADQLATAALDGLPSEREWSVRQTREQLRALEMLR